MEIFEQLHQQNFITQKQLDKIKQQQPVSVHWDIRTLLYLGILLITTALSIIVYKNIDTIGHTAILIAIGIACAACFMYCFKKTNRYQHAKVESPNILFDYILLSGCLLLLTFIGYLQYEYNVFGNRWGLAVFIPMVILFFCAYYFDHIGVLSIAITNFAAWLGITVTPLQILKQNNFGDTHLISTGIILGAALIIFSIITQQKNIKAHFAFTYKNFGVNILFIALLSAMFNYDNIYLVWFLIIMAVAYLLFNNAVKQNAFYFFVITVLYAYIALCYVVIELLTSVGGDMGVIYLGLIYFIGSGIGLIRLLMYYNKKLKDDAGI
ncbi:MAG: DUF2157 domain-containing protein [Parafilimonas sp.]